MPRNLLLISNSTLHGSKYLDHCEPQIKEFLGETKEVVFVPYARPGGISYDDYTALARARLELMGYKVRGIQEFDSPQEAIRSASALFVGGGNTFQLLQSLYKRNLRTLICKRIFSEGLKYIGTSAGANVAGEKIHTTNDMPALQPPSFRALGLVPFFINPHYQDPISLTPEKMEAVLAIAPELESILKHQGETRPARIKEVLALNDYVKTVVALREGAMLEVTGNRLRLLGRTSAKIFKRNQEPTEHFPGESLDFLLTS